MMCPLCPRPDHELNPVAWAKAQLVGGRKHCQHHDIVTPGEPGRGRDSRGRLVYAPRQNAALEQATPGPRSVMPHQVGQIGLTSELLTDSPDVTPFGRMVLGKGRR